MKKVAIFINSLRGGGAERIVSYLLKEGYRHYEMHLILLQEEIEYDIPRDHIRIFELEGGRVSKFSSIFRMKALSKKLKDYLETHKIDTLLSLLNRPNLIACRAKQSGWSGKLIISERADTIAYYKTIRFGWYMIRLVRKYYPYADAVTVISKGIARSLGKLGIQDCRVIYNPIYLTAAAQGTKEPGQPFTFINIARLEPQKNQALLLRAFARVPGNDSRLVILGKGHLLDELKKLAAELGITGRVHFAGFQSDIRAYLLQADCFVFSSDYEGLGNVIIEALQAGLPVISTDCPYGPREILAPESDTDTLIKTGVEQAPYGILTPAGNEQYLAAAMELLMNNETLRDGYRRKAVPRSHDFDIAVISKKYFDLF